MFKYYFTDYKINKYLLDNLAYVCVTFVAALVTVSVTNLISGQGFYLLLIKDWCAALYLT